MVGFLGLETDTKELSLREPWRCTGCSRLMYNLDPRGYPCRGAPIPLYVNKDHVAVCSLCYDLSATIEKADWTYWHSLPATRNKVRPDQHHTY